MKYENTMIHYFPLDSNDLSVHILSHQIKFSPLRSAASKFKFTWLSLSEATSVFIPHLMPSVMFILVPVGVVIPPRHSSL